jgi:hypothetical protein
MQLLFRDPVGGQQFLLEKRDGVAFPVHRETEPHNRPREEFLFALFSGRFCADLNPRLLRFFAFTEIIAQQHEYLFLNGLSGFPSQYTLNLVQNDLMR